MIVTRICGGLGNQMFQYAFGRALAERMGVELKLDPSRESAAVERPFQLKEVFGISAGVAATDEVDRLLGWGRHEVLRKVAGKLGFHPPRWIEEPHFRFDPKLQTVADNSYLSGYWQSHRYFSDAADTVRREFSFCNELSEPSRKIACDMSRGDRTPVSVHVRLGDYLSHPATHRRHGICPREYYSAAFAYISERVERPCCYLFSDDIEGARASFPQGFTSVAVEHHPGVPSHEDLRLMSLCRHHIIANSSYSWWGAWLNPDPEKIVVAPEKWFADGTDAADLIPPGWVKLS